MAKEYIEREALIKEFYLKLCGYINFGEFVGLARNAPAADVVEVVRCKDCVFYVSEICRQDLALNLCRGDDFCSYGERKEK